MSSLYTSERPFVLIKIWYFSFDTLILSEWPCFWSTIKGQLVNRVGIFCLAYFPHQKVSSLGSHLILFENSWSRFFFYRVLGLSRNPHRWLCGLIYSLFIQSQGDSKIYLKQRFLWCFDRISLTSTNCLGILVGTQLSSDVFVPMGVYSFEGVVGLHRILLLSFKGIPPHPGYSS